MFTLEVARSHVRDLQREAERAQDRQDARGHHGSPLARMVRRARYAR